MDLGSLAPTLVIGIGNPSRGDDALGPAALEHLSELAVADVDLLTDFQLAPEHALDLIDRARVVFVDAAVDGDAPFRLEALTPKHDTSVSSHALSPAAVLDTFVCVTGLKPPKAHVLAIRGYDFDLGKGLSPGARANLEAALEALIAYLREGAPLPA